MSTPLSAPCLGQRGLSGSGAAQPAMATPASAPGQLQLGHRSPPSVGSPAGGPAAPAGPAQAQPSNLDGSAHRLGQHPMQHKRAAEPPASGQMQFAAEVAQQWHCARCRQPLPAGATGSDGCKCDMVQPTKRLNTGSSGRMHSRVEGLDEGQMEKLLDLAQELGLITVSSSGSAGQPSWIPRLAGSPSPRPSLQPGAAQSAAPGQRDMPAWHTSSRAQQQPVWPQAWQEGPEKQLCRAAADLHALVTQQDVTAEHAPAAEQRQQAQSGPRHMLRPPVRQGQQQRQQQPQQQRAATTHQQSQQQPQQQRHKHQQRQQQERMLVPQQPQRTAPHQQQQQQHAQRQPSPRTPVDQLLPAPEGPPALVGVPGSTAPRQRDPPPPPPALRSFESLPAPLPAQPAMLQRYPSEPLPVQHQQPRLRPYQPQQQPPEVQQMQAGDLQPADMQWSPAEQHTPAQDPQGQEGQPHAQQWEPAQRAQQPRRQQEQKQQKQQKQQKKQKKQKRQQEQPQQPGEGSPSTRNAADQGAGPGTARELAAALLGKVFKQVVAEQAADIAAWQREQRQLLLEAHEEQNKQLRLAHQVQLLQLERAHLLGMARQGSEPLPASPAAAQPRLPMDLQPRQAHPAAQQRRQQDGQAQPGAQQHRWGEIASFLLRVQSRHGR